MININPDRGVINKGNWGRIKNVMKKAAGGDDITVAFLGGSITQGCHSSVPEKCYARLVHKWWVDKFPKAKVEFINAGIGGTTSQFGVARVKQHVLIHNPDFLLTEFAVNDENTEFFKETYESLVRVILSSANAPSLMLMNNVQYDTGNNAEDMHLAVAKHYDLPMVSMKNTIYAAVWRGEIEPLSVSTDYLHPNDLGHEMVAEVIINLLEKIYASFVENEEKRLSMNNQDGGEKEYMLLPPITPSRYEDSLRMKNYNMSDGTFEVSLKGFVADDRKKQYFLDIFSGGFTACKEGDAISFETECTGFAVQYKKTVNKPAPVAIAIIDDEEANPVILDANFEETWGDCLYIETVAEGMPLGKHKIEIRITENHEDDKSDFYLVSVIRSK